MHIVGRNLFGIYIVNLNDAIFILKNTNLKGIQMKNTLSENMLRFGTKNLSEANLQNLTEVDGGTWNKTMGDPQWLLYPAGQFANQFGSGITFKYKPGSTYTQNFSYAAKTVGESKIFILPKGTKWTISPSGYFLLANIMQVVSGNFGYGKNAADAELTGLQDGMYLAKVATGKAIGTDGKPVQVQKTFAAINGHAPTGILYPNGDTVSNMIWPNRNLSDALAKLQA
jgi:hypothetical protein